ncbi:MAG TPA: biotin-dependent carboxyltransferase family protein, partial [Chitinophagaceae bacterium]|nr:biotin-dependent carboxyltransferase family protein [Chitinophagaceae bacterium]
MSLEITKGGILDTIQDGGRHGYQHLGINPGGAMDRFSAQLSNALLGKDLKAPVIELHFPAASFLFKKNCIICLAGADFSAFLHEEQIPLHQPVFIKAGSVLGFKNKIWGARCYLSILHEMQIDKWLGSYSTNVKAEAGGWNGRKLQSGDKIDFIQNDLLNKQNIHHLLLPWKTEGIKKSFTTSLNVLVGNEWNWLTDISQHSFLQNDFQLSISADRMGYRLTGKKLKTKEEASLLSSAVNFGTIQLLPDGRLIILMADHQTTGGYPRVAHVISGDLSLLAQTNPNE